MREMKVTYGDASRLTMWGTSGYYFFVHPIKKSPGVILGKYTASGEVDSSRWPVAVMTESHSGINISIPSESWGNAPTFSWKLNVY
jgi:hypothetical protein